MTKKEQKNVMDSIQAARLAIRKANISVREAYLDSPVGTSIESGLEAVSETLFQSYSALAECYVSVHCYPVEPDCLSEEGGLE